MLYHLLYPLRDLWFGFNVFKYITFRAVSASITAFLISIIVGPILIKKLKEMKVVEVVLRPDAPAIDPHFKDKADTPTMGGVLIISAIVVSMLLWADIFNKYVIISIVGVLWLGAIGFMDDYAKLTISGKKRGLGARVKFIAQMFLGVLVGVYLYFSAPDFPKLIEVPFFKDIFLNLGMLYILFVALVVVGSSNAVNLTDGLDGLAIGCVMIMTFSYGVMSYIAGNFQFSNYLNVTYIPGSGELTVLCAAIIGSSLGFLWFNSYPATVFMGDTGSLALGGAIGLLAVLIKKELLLVMVGGIFVLEALSVIIQVFHFKLTKQRVFLMAPFHHHLQLSGWKESKITIRMWIIAIILALASLATLKLR